MPKYNDFELDIQEEKSEIIITDAAAYSNWTCRDRYTMCLCKIKD